MDESNMIIDLNLSGISYSKKQHNQAKRCSPSFKQWVVLKFLQHVFVAFFILQMTDSGNTSFPCPFVQYKLNDFNVQESNQALILIFIFLRYLWIYKGLVDHSLCSFEKKLLWLFGNFFYMQLFLWQMLIHINCTFLFWLLILDLN